MSRLLPFLLVALWAGCASEPDASAPTPPPAEGEAPPTFDIAEAPPDPTAADPPDAFGPTVGASETDAPFGTTAERPSSQTASTKATTAKGGGVIAGKDPTPYDELAGWIGEYPVLEDGTHFATQPAVALFLEDALSVEPEVLGHLGNLATEPVFLAEPIEYVGGAFALEFAPNGRVGEEERSLFILIHGTTGATVAVLNGDGNTYYRASYNARIADFEDEAVAWISQASGEDVRALATQTETLPLGP